MSKPTAAPNYWPYMSHRTLDQVPEFRMTRFEAISRYRRLCEEEARELASLRRELCA